MKFLKYKEIDKIILSYIITLFTLFILIIETPSLVADGFSILREEHVELVLLAIITLTGATVYRAYRREIKKKDDAYLEMTKHVGKINRQIEQVKTLSQILTKIPESKNDMKTLLNEMSKRVLEIVPSDWVVIRAIDSTTKKTLTEQNVSRGKTILLKYEISNENLLNEVAMDDYTTIQSSQKNIDVKVYCVIPVLDLTEEQKVLIQAMVDEIVLLYLVFTSGHYTQIKTSSNKKEPS